MRIGLILVLLVMWGGVSIPAEGTDGIDGQLDANDVQAQTTGDEIAPSNNTETGKDIEQEKKELRLMLVTSIIILSLFFLGVLLISLLRIGRRYRRRVQLGKPDGPTEYVDAWSQYRLKEDEDEKTTGEEENKS
jgi:hypothetical protein